MYDGGSSTFHIPTTIKVLKITSTQQIDLNKVTFV